MSTAIPLHVCEAPGQVTSLLHPMRRQILDELTEPDTAAGVARRLGVDRQKVNYHVRHLEAEGLVEMVEERRNRGCTERVVQAVARSYLIDPHAAGGAGESDPARIRDRFSSAYLIAVAARAVSELARLRDLALGREKRVATLTIETEVRFGTPADQHAFAEELGREVGRIAAKYQDDGAAEGRSFRLFLGAYPTLPPDPHEAEEATS
jgi:DNA-binding transcriptional ArsR family regulator